MAKKSNKQVPAEEPKVTEQEPIEVKAATGEEENEPQAPVEEPVGEPDGLNTPEEQAKVGDVVEETPSEPVEEEPVNEAGPSEELGDGPADFDPDDTENNKPEDESKVDYEALQEEFKDTDKKIEKLVEDAKSEDEVKETLEKEIDRVKGLEQQIKADIAKSEKKVKKVLRVDDFNDFWNGTSFT